MKTFFLSISLLAFCLLLSSCEKEKSGILDINLAGPFISAVTLNHYSLNLSADSTGSVEKIDSAHYKILILFTGKVIKQSAQTPERGNLQIFKPNASSAFIRTAFNIQTAGPDTFAFSQTISFTINNTDVGLLRFEFQVGTNSGNQSNLVQQSLLITRGFNHPPTLFNVIAPDTVVLPPADSTLIRMTATVNDSDGLADIKEVFFYSLNSTNPRFKFQLYDDGSLNSTPPSGDQVAGDGIYTITVKLVDSPTVRKTYTFEFHAFDKQSASSAPISKQLTVQ